MKRKSRSDASTKTSSPKAVRASPIPEPFQLIGFANVSAGDVTTKVPMLVLYGEWLKAVGFPIGSAAYLTTDRRGEMTLNRLGLSLPRRVYIRAAKSAKRSSR